MDKLSLSFSQEAAIRQIDDCTNIAELKALTKSLMKSHFETRTFIAQLMLRELPNSKNVKLP
jgi:hypothetical protein